MADYTQDRLAALFKRVASLERTVEVAGAFLERGLADPSLLPIDAPLALATLKAGIQDGFRSAILCSPDMTADQLDHWLSQMAPVAGEQAAPS
jgi:hypothetical protein